MKIAYLVNQYPKVSHSFIRREISAVEACGVEVLRFSIRSCSSELVDAADKAELEKTQIILSAGALGLLSNFVWVLATKPVRLLTALWLTIKVGYRSERGLLRNFIYLVEACVFLNQIAKCNVDHVHAHFGTNSTTVAMLCRELGGPPYSFTVHGPEEFDKVQAIALPEKIKRAVFVVAISSFGKSQLYRWCNSKDWAKIYVIRCGLDDSFFEQSLTPIPTSSSLVCVGRLCEQKGQLLLVRAIAHLASEGFQIKLVLVGDGPLRTEIEQLIVTEQLHQQIEITGWASSSMVCGYLTNARAMVLPSFAEGLPVVIMEAFAMGRPVISTYIAGIPELVGPDCGWLIPAGSVEELVDALKLVLRSPVETLEEMGKLGAERVSQQHCAKTEASKLVTLFQSSIERSGSRLNEPFSST